MSEFLGLQELIQMQVLLEGWNECRVGQRKVNRAQTVLSSFEGIGK